MNDLDELAAVRVALKGARGVALDADELDLDIELARAIDRVAALASRLAALERVAEAARDVTERVPDAGQRLRAALDELDAG